MSKNKIGAIIALDGEKEFRSAVTACNKELTNLRSESKLVKEQFEGQSNTLEALRAKHEVLEKTLDAHKKKVKETENGLKHAKESYDKMGAGIGKLEEAYRQASSRMALMENTAGTTEEALKKQREETERLSVNLKKSRENYEKAGTRIQEWETKLNTAKAQLIKANRELEINEKYLDEARKSTDKCATSIDAYGKKVKESVDATISWKEAVKGAFAGKVTSEAIDSVKELASQTVQLASAMDGSANQIQASTGATAAEMEKYKDILMDVYGNNYGDDLNDVADAVSKVKQNLGDLSEVQMQDVTEDMIAMRDTFGFDYQEQLRSVKMLMDTFGISSEKAYNLIAQGAQKGLNKNGDLLDTINEYAVHYKQMGVGAEGFFNSLANGTAAGTFSVDKLGDAYKEFGIRVKDTANTTTEGFELLGMDADEMREKFAAGGESAKKATNEVLEALFNMDNQVQQNQAGVDLFGTMWEDLGRDGIQALMNLNGEISMTNDALTSMKDIKYDDIGNQITQIGRTIQLKFAEPLAKKFLPAISDGLEVAGDNLETVGVLAAGLGTVLAVYKVSNAGWFAGIIKSLKSMRTAWVATTAATEGATVATKIFNAVAALSPVGKITLAITAATAAFAAFKAITTASNSEMNKQREEVNNLSKEMDSLTESVEENRKSREEAQQDTEAEFMAYQNLSDTLFDLAEKEGKTTLEKEKMKIVVDQLNEAIPGLNLAIDEQTGALNMNKQALDAVIESMKNKALMAAMEDEMTEIAKEQARVTIEVMEAEEKKAELDDKIAKLCKEQGLAYDGTTDFMLKYISTVNDASEEGQRLATEMAGLSSDWEELDKTIQKGNETIDASNEELDRYRDATARVSEKMGIAAADADNMTNAVEATGQAAELSGTEAENSAGTISNAYEALKNSLESSLGGTASLFDEFNGGQEVTTETMLENLKSQREGLEEWRDNMSYLAEQAGKGMSENLYLYLAEMGPQGANAVNALAEALRSGSGDFEKICADWEEIISIEDKASGLADEYYNVGANVADSTARGIKDNIYKVEEAGRDLGNASIRSTKWVAQIKSPSKVFRNEIGKMIALGMALGITDGTGNVEDSSRKMSEDAIDAAIKTLDIHSPSRVFRDKVGFMISTGVAFGIRKGKDTVKRASQEMTTEIYKKAEENVRNWHAGKEISMEEEKKYWTEIRRYLKTGTKEYENASKKIRNLDFSIKISNKGNFGVSKYIEKDTKDGIEKVKKTAAQYSADILDASASWLSRYKAQHDMTVEQEVVFWQQIRKQLKKGTAAYKEATQNIKAASKSAAQERLSASDKALTQYKTYYKVSAKSEVEYWNIVRKQFKTGTDERIEADQKYYEAKESLNEQLKALNEEYVQNCADVQSALKEDIQELTDAYNDAVKERAESIYSSVGLFDEFFSESESGEKLLYNLKTQVAGIADWELQLQELAKRGLPTNLIDELQEMGPEASASLHALNSLTDEQLKEYVSLWEQKHDLSESQAVKELEPMRKETQEQINKLTTTAKAELAELKKEYTAAVKELSTGISSALKKVANSTKKIGEDATAALISGIKSGAKKKSTTAELDSAKTTIEKGLGSLPKAGKIIGTNTLEGLVSGLTNEKTISKSAKQLVESLKAEIKKAADIHSPSRLFKKEIGEQLSAGVAEGITDENAGVNRAGAYMIQSLLDSTKKEITQQQDNLREYMETINSGTGLLELQNLISVAPVQQVNATVDNSSLVSLFGEMLAVMQEYLPRVGNMKMVTDTGTIIGETSVGIGNELAMMNRRRR